MSLKLKIPILLLVILSISSCLLIPGPTQPAPDPDMFELPKINIEAELPDESIKDPDFIMIFKIDRIGHVTDPNVNWVQEDTILVDVAGKNDDFLVYLYGLDENGEQNITGDNGECVMTCKGKIGYRVQGVLVPETDCKIKIWITQFGKPASCTSSCLPPDNTIPWNTAVGETFLEEMDTDLTSLSRGVTREEVVGNMHWGSTYTLIGVAGNIDKKICDFEEPGP